MGKLTDRLAHAWNAFTDQGQTQGPFDRQYNPLAQASSYADRPDRVRYRITGERSIVSSIYTRLAVDFAQIPIRHVRLDDNGRFLEDMDSGLNTCLTLEANLDQSGRSLRQDKVLTLFDKGTIAVVPVDSTLDPNITGGFDVLSLRVGEIVKWFPRHVRVNLYNENTGRREEVTLEKKFVAIVENPFYMIMNEPNSTLQRLIRKLNLLDVVDEQSSSGKLDLIIQVPYTVKSDTRKAQAEARRKDIEFQLKGSQYGIAYADATEKITQLNRPAENNLLTQVEYLTKMLFSQLGLTEEIMNGTADEATMLNYYNRTIEPLLDAFAEEYKRKFLTKTARTQKQSIEYFRDPFKLVPIANIAEIADKFTRNEVLSSNEIRSVIGIKPSTDPKADQLRNSNMPAPSETASPGSSTNQEGDSQNGS